MVDTFLMSLWRRSAGLPEDVENCSEKLPSYLELRNSEWDGQFENLMRNRMIMGAIRYGRLRAKGKPKYDRTQSIEKRLNLYRKTGNLEYLVDIANLAMLEFVEGEHPLRNFSSIDDGEHVQTK